jgi:hypothetical protein
MSVAANAPPILPPSQFQNQQSTINNPSPHRDRELSSLAREAKHQSPANSSFS